ncbi:hypothetical protein COV49_01545 [Candidatus Falkowbacteria bacterium CG11_big_fil_rev_8_21_14_0_20_39_10]|uniref:Uncharacterized protein n=1 Tax=Candidatus Falkowbacteria bacterium CG11_big_fil_rev_8_21_14_0_20_39_10 TaxID=1974570 RepID=A0A2M6K9T7_9BACT|nr:MAG: hypothetical protein COV49_01545 [Candidatus Falkowbacteria bacterium CG11_big_fil_rev_8_21_14_0_20_39_10]
MAKRFELKGDVSQRQAQKTALLGTKIRVKDDCFRNREDFEIAIKVFFDKEVAGFQHYENELLASGLCTKKEFDSRVDEVGLFLLGRMAAEAGLVELV